MERQVANDLQTQPVTEHQIRTHLAEIDAQLATMRFLPRRLAVLAGSVQSVLWPNGAERLHLPVALEGEFGSRDREYAMAHLRELGELMAPDKPDVATAAMLRLYLLTKLQLGLPIARGTSEEAAEARGDFYEIAVEDMPPWAVHKAIKRWIRHEINGIGLTETNTTYAPGPTALRQICEDVLKPLRDDGEKLARLLRTMPQRAAMDPKWIEPAPVAFLPPKGTGRAAPALQRMSA
jgi:hypothetical protein